MKKILLSFLFFAINLVLIAQTNNTFFGVNSNRVHPSKAEKLNFSQAYGSYLTSIVPGTSADRSGFEPFDYILKIGDYQLNAQTSLGHVLNNYNPGDEVIIDFLRNGLMMSRKVKLGDDSERKSTSRPPAEDPFLGIHQTHWSGGENMGIKVKIQEGSTAEEMGLIEDDIVIMVDNYPIVDWHDVGAAIDYREVCDKISVTVKRGEQTITYSGIIQSEIGPGNCYKVEDQIQTLLAQQVLVETEIELEEVSTEERIDFKNKNGIDMPEVSDLMVESLNLFPNPNIGQFQISFNLEGKGNVIIRIFDARGKLMLSKDLPDFSGYYQEGFDLGEAPAGVYYLMVRQGVESMTRKIIVARN